MEHPGLKHIALLEPIDPLRRRPQLRFRSQRPLELVVRLSWTTPGGVGGQQNGLPRASPHPNRLGDVNDRVRVLGGEEDLLDGERIVREHLAQHSRHRVHRIEYRIDRALRVERGMQQPGERNDVAGEGGLNDGEPKSQLILTRLTERVGQLGLKQMGAHRGNQPEHTVGEVAPAGIVRTHHPLGDHEGATGLGQPHLQARQQTNPQRDCPDQPVQRAEMHVRREADQLRLRTVRVGLGQQHPFTGDFPCLAHRADTWACEAG